MDKICYWSCRKVSKPSTLKRLKTVISIYSKKRQLNKNKNSLKKSKKCLIKNKIFLIKNLNIQASNLFLIPLYWYLKMKSKS